MKKLLFVILSLFALSAQAQSGKIIGGSPPRYITRVAVKPDLTLYASNNTEADLSALGDSLGGRNMVTLIITKPTGVSVNPSFPAITDTLLGTKIKVKTYFETSSEQIGIFQSDLGFVTGYDGTAYTDNGTILFVQDLEEFTLWPVEDVNGLHWAYTKTSGTGDGNGLISALPSGDVTIETDNTLQLKGSSAIPDSSAVNFFKEDVIFGGLNLLELNGKAAGGLSGYQSFNSFTDYGYQYHLAYNDVGDEVRQYVGAARGSRNNPKALIKGDRIGGTYFWAYKSGGWRKVGVMRAEIDSIYSGSNPSARIIFGATENNSPEVSSQWRFEVNAQGTISHLDHRVRNILRIGSAATTYALPNGVIPSNTNLVKSFMTWTGTGSGATPAFETVNSAITGTARIVPYMNTSGRFVTGNTYFKLDTNTTSGAQARVRLLINNPNGDAGEGDSYSALSVRAGDGLGTEAIFNIGDQAATMGTTGYGSVFQLSRSGGNFTTKTNLSNGNEVGKFAWRGYVNGGSRALGHIQLNYRGDGTTILSDLIGASAVSGSIVSGWKLDEQSRFWLGSGADDYYFPTIAPSNTNLAKNILIWTGTGSAPATPAWGTITGLMVDGQFTTGTPTLTAFGTGSYQRYTAVVELTGGASANTNIPLPTADATSYGKSILISPRDLNTSYNINATGSIEYGGASVSSIHLTKPTEFVCNIVGTGPTTYRWVMVDNAPNDGSSSTSTDASGDIVITHNKNHTNYKVLVQATGTTLGIGYTVTAKTATTFTVRFYDTSTKAAIASTSVPFDWFIKE